LLGQPQPPLCRPCGARLSIPWRSRSAIVDPPFGLQ
jgi:hypothetical protein